MRAISQEILQPSITKISEKMTYLKFPTNFPGTNNQIAYARHVCTSDWVIAYAMPQMSQEELTHWGWDKMVTIFKCIFLNENVSIVIKISLKFIPKGPINNIPALVQTMAWHWPDDKPLSEPMMVSLLMHICVIWPQWVNCIVRVSRIMGK